MLSYDNIITITGSEQRLLDFLTVHTEVTGAPSLQEISDEFIHTVYGDPYEQLHDERAREEYLTRREIRYPKWPYHLKASLRREWDAFRTSGEIYVMSENEICLRLPTWSRSMEQHVYDLSRWYPDLQFLLTTSPDTNDHDEILVFRDGDASEVLSISSQRFMWDQENWRTIEFSSKIVDEKDGQLRLVIERRGIDDSWIPIWSHGVGGGGVIEKEALEESEVDLQSQTESNLLGQENE